MQSRFYTSIWVSNFFFVWALVLNKNSYLDIYFRFYWVNQVVLVVPHLSAGDTATAVAVAYPTKYFEARETGRFMYPSSHAVFRKSRRVFSCYPRLLRFRILRRDPLYQQNLFQTLSKFFLEEELRSFKLGV